MKTIILALCIFAVAFAAPGRDRRPPKTDEDGNTLPPPMKDDVELTEEEFDDLIEACEALADDEEKRQDEPELEEVCRELAKMLEEGPKGPRPTKGAEKRASKEDFENLIKECEALAGDEKRQDEPELEEVCRELAKMLEEGPKGPRPTQEAEKRADLDSAAEEFGGALVGLCQALDALVELANSVGNQKRSWESIIEGLGGICTDVKTALEADMGSDKRGMPSKDEFEALIEECEALAGDEKRQDEPELEEVCRHLAKMLEDGPKGPRPTQEAEKREGKGPRTDEDGNTLPPRPKLSKDELEALKEECEALANDGEKRQDEPALEDVCRELAKMMRRPRPRTDEDGNPVPRPTRPAQERRRFHF